VRIRKGKSPDDIVSEILCDEKPVLWAAELDHFAFGERIPPRSERCFRVLYPEQAKAGRSRRSLRFELSVAARLILSEFRDDYLSTSRFLSAPAERMKSLLRKAV